MATQKTTEERLAELESRVEKLEGLLSATGGSTQSTGSKKKVSPKEFLNTKQFKSEAEKTLILGYFLETAQDMTSFHVADLMSVFQSAKEKRPQNLNDVVNRNVARGFFMEAPEKKDSKKAWTLTATGERYVEEQLTK